MTNITIPPEALEAAAISLMGKLMVSNEDAQHLWDRLYEPEKNRFRLEAIAAIRAALAAWPGRVIESYVSQWPIEQRRFNLILPLPQEKTDG